MANFCSNNIVAKTTESEWKEISNAFNDNQIDWPGCLEGPSCSDYSKTIWCLTKWSPTPWEEGYMKALSRSYPSAIFHYKTNIEGEYRSPSTWFCSGYTLNKREAESTRKHVYEDEVERFLVASPVAAEGIEHRVEIMADGRVAADGENRFGECNIFEWNNIAQISRGNWHTVGLTNDGTIIACGSNANKQCDFSDIFDPIKSISCGRYHTAILLNSGRVIVKGVLEQEAENTDDEVQLKETDFPIEIDLTLNKYISGWEDMNERIELITVGEELSLKKVTRNGEAYFEVFNVFDEKIGDMYYENCQSLAKILKNIRATAANVTPLSQRRKGSKYAAMTIKLEYVAVTTKSKKTSSKTLGNYVQTRVNEWPAVCRIKSVYDAVIGVTEDGQLFVDGFCPCSEADLFKIMGISE